MTIGLNISGGEFGGTAGVHDQQYHYPTFSELQFYRDKGVDFVRLPFSWERMQDSLGGPLDTSGDLAMLKRVLVDAAALGLDVIIDNHNYGRFKGVALGAAGGPTPAQFADFWKKMAIELKDYPALAGYDLMNEPHDMPNSTIWKESAQAATNAIRTVDTVNTIIIEGDNWSGAHSWANSNNATLIINDPANNIVYQAHQYLDRDGSGSYRGSYDAEGAYANIGVDKLKGFVDWLNANGLKGMIGEFGVPSNDVRWLEAQKNMLDYMNANNLDGTAWAGGAWWPSNYELYTAAPGRADSAFGDLLEKYYGQFDGFETGGPGDPPVVTLAPSVAINDVLVSENAGTATFTVTRSGDLSKASSVAYHTTNGSAVAGSDYATISGTVSFAAGEHTKTITVAITNDNVVEGNEAFTVSLKAGTNVIIADGLGNGTINNDDVPAVTPPPVIVLPVTPPIIPVGFPTFATVSGTEGNDNINADWAREDYVDAKGGDDFIIGVGSRDYIDGGAGSDTISYHWSGAHVDVDLTRATQVNGDANGDVLVNIENITGSGNQDRLAGNDLANVINGLGGRDILSGRGGSDRFVFNSASDANGDLITDYSASDTLDFASFNPRSLSLTNDGVNTRIVGDTNGDGVGDFTVTLNGVHTSVNGIKAGAIETPAPPVISLAPTVAINDVTVSESAGTATFTVSRSGNVAAASTVNFSTSNGTASAGLDFAALVGAVSFAANETSKTVTIAIVNDALVEGTEAFTVNLTGGTNVTNVTIVDGSGTATINNDDVVAVIPAPAVTPPPVTPTGFPSAPTISGTEGNDNINADWSRMDYVDAKGGDDFISGVGSKDYINGGAGNDTISYHWSGAYVDVDLTRATQANGDANGDFLVNIENVTGSGNHDRLAGDNFANVITGLGGSDVLSGRGGNDRFVFDTAGNANGDTVTDFTSGDQLDFRSMDADSKVAGDQAFIWLDTGAFTGSAGQLREYDLNGSHYVAGDITGDGVADFTIKMSGSLNLSSGDFLF